MRKSFKYRIYLTNGQRRILEQQLEECRWVYNETLAERKRAYEERGESLRLYDTQMMLPVWKMTRPSLTLVHSQVLQNVNIRVDLAFQAFFRRVKAGENPGYPRFKSFGRYDSITYPQYGNGVRLDGERLILSKVGAVHVVLHRPVEGAPKTVTLQRSPTGKWYACFSCETEANKLHPVDKIVGIDVGLASFLTTSSGGTVPNPRFYRKDEADLARVQQRLSDAKNQQDWVAYRKRKRAVAHIHERIANRRTDFAHKLSRVMVNTYQVIALEDLAPLEMGRSRGMRKSIRDVAWSQFVSMTCVKAEEAGRTVVLVDPAYTSQRCSSCGERVKKTLSDRTHACPHCGLVLDRDHNAALNILHRGLQQLRL
ncbi:RNA-guided endonuclease InsQ/TnpB family protein [Candidatus Chloroploca asiatica]|uniref:Transposase n=1 Tax=Candidatus Chloroploca asiatica TaxID=1506545 RepID=A0A2H3L2L9_9CHLR|nr:RNA-guided endonuclease TnpB family protein [Candidatus Chloroploca asiatica]PDV98999.1 transposase [Candidatus Chloroploca asiatica]